MKGLATLIRLHKRNLDELRRDMVRLENEKSQLEQAIINLQAELDREMELAETSLEMASFFGEFAKRIKNRQEILRGEIQQVDKKIAKLNDEIFVEFAEVKKFEIALEMKKSQKAEAEKRKETIMLDEIAAQQHRKNRQ